MKKVALVLGGGGARGLSHLGVLCVLEKEKIPIDMIIGTSMGAIIGACYACYSNAAEVEAIVRKSLKGSAFANMRLNIFDEKPEDKKNLFDKAQDFIKYGYIHIAEHTKYSILELVQLEDIINSMLPDIDIKETKIPFTCVATDITYGEEKVFTHGSLRKCVLASSSIPGIFPPIEIDGIFYSDGGAVNVTPVSAARNRGAGLIIACDVKSKVIRWDKPEKAVDVISRTNYITGTMLNNICLKDADVLIMPAIKYLHWSDFDKINLMIKEGEKAAAQSISLIRAKLGALNIWDTIKKWFKRMR